MYSIGSSEPGDKDHILTLVCNAETLIDINKYQKSWHTEDYHSE